ncbi:MAG: hypothetical protein WBG36_11560 [Ornithinimicrobium sp.]
MPNIKAALGWLFAPATEDVPKHQAMGVTFLRILIGLLWLYNVSWKRAPNFGEEANNGLWKFTNFAVEHPVFPPYTWVVETFVLPVFQPFGWGVLLSETALAVLLLTGTYIRVAALLGIAQSVAIALSVAFAPEEWPWAYWMMIGAHVVLLLSSSGRYLAVDGVRARVVRTATLGQVWGGLAVLLGLYSTLMSFGDPFAARGPGLRSSDLSISFGNYNLLGGLLLIILGAMLIMAARWDAEVIAKAAAGLAVVAGLSLHAQLGFTDPVLGGNPTSAAFLFCIGVVAGAIAVVPARRRSKETVAA